jgi:hypothetical protein
MSNQKKPNQKRRLPSELKFKYVFPEYYTPLYVNGVWGGLGPKGELEIHFIYDRNPLPWYSVHELTESGLKGEAKKMDKGDSILRFVQTGVMMNLDCAKSLHEWLGQKIKLLEEAADESRKKQK